MSPSDTSNTDAEATVATPVAASATPTTAAPVAASTNANDPSTSLFKRIADAVETEVEDVEVKAEDVWNDDIKPFIVNDVEPFLKSSLLLIERNGGTLLMSAAVTVLNDAGEILSGKWGDAVTTIITAAKAAGATFVTGEEQIAASTALQLTQASVQTAPAATVTAAASISA